MKSLALALLLSPAFAHAQTAQADTADAHFQAIYKAEWDWRMQQAPGYDEDSDNSARKPATRLQDVGPDAQAKRLAHLDGVLRQLDGIDPKALSPEEQVNYAVYRPQIAHMAAEIRFRDFQMPFNSDSSFWSDLGFMARADLRDADAYRACATCRVTSTSRSPTCARAWRAASACRARCWTGATAPSRWWPT